MALGVYAYNNTGGPYTINMTDVLVDGFQKNGLALNGAGDGLTVAPASVTTPGAGPTAVTAQNGIQIGYGATGTITNCDVSAITYTPADWWASGILVYVAGPVDISGTTSLPARALSASTMEAAP